MIPEKDDSHYLRKMLADVDYIIDKMQNVSLAQFSEYDLLIDAMNFRLIQINESAKKITAEFKAMHCKIPWSEISGLRNRIVHDYGNSDVGIIYCTLSEDIPKLKNLILEGLTEEFGHR